MKSKLRIIFATQNVGVDLTNSQEGNAIKIRYIIDLLQNAGHFVRLISMVGGRKVLLSDKLTNLEWAELGFSGNRIFTLVESASRRLQALLRLPYLALFDSLRQYDLTLKYADNIDIIHEHVGLFSLGSAVAAARLQIPYVLNWEGDIILEREYIGNPLRGIELHWANYAARRSLRTAAALIVVSKAYKTSLVNRWQVDPGKVFVLPNGVDTQLFRPAADPLRRKQELGLGDRPVIMFVGSFWPWHGLDVLVESFQQVHAQVPEALLVLVGDGKVRPAITARVQQLGLEKAVHFTGRVPLDQVPVYLQAADITTAPFPGNAPNSQLGSPMKIYEYMAAGKAVVSTRIGQIPEIIDEDETGVLVEPGDAQALGDSMLDLLRDPEKQARLGAAAREKAVAEYSWEHFTRSLEKVYQYALQNKAAA